MKRALVTGGTGFIGSNIVKKLVSDNWEVIATGNDSENSLPNVEILRPSFIGLDLDRIGKVDVVFHQAAMNLTVSRDQKEMERANVESTLHLFDKCISQGCRKFVYASSTAVYGDVEIPFKESGLQNPLNAYGKSKQLMENAISIMKSQYPNVNFIGLRYCNVYGLGEQHKGRRASMIYQIAKAMRTRPPKLFEFGEQKRDYIYIKDVVRANLLAAEKTENETFVVNCGSGRSTSYNEIVNILNKILDKHWKPTYIPNPRPEEYQNHTLCDMTMAKEKLNFTPEYDITSGIMDYKYCYGF